MSPELDTKEVVPWLTNVLKVDQAIIPIIIFSAMYLLVVVEKISNRNRNVIVSAKLSKMAQTHPNTLFRYFLSRSFLDSLEISE